MSIGFVPKGLNLITPKGKIYRQESWAILSKLCQFFMLKFNCLHKILEGRKMPAFVGKNQVGTAVINPVDVGKAEFNGLYVPSTELKKLRGNEKQKEKVSVMAPSLDSDGFNMNEYRNGVEDTDQHFL